MLIYKLPPAQKIPDIYLTEDLSAEMAVKIFRNCIVGKSIFVSDKMTCKFLKARQFRHDKMEDHYISFDEKNPLVVIPLQIKQERLRRYTTLLKQLPAKENLRFSKNRYTGIVIENNITLYIDYKKIATLCTFCENAIFMLGSGNADCQPALCWAAILRVKEVLECPSMEKATNTQS